MIQHQEMPMSARLALFALATFVLADSIVLSGSTAFAQTVVNGSTPVITTTPRAPATFNGNAYYTPGGNSSTTVTDKAVTSGNTTITSRTIDSTTPTPDPFQPNSYSLDGFTPTPPGYANAGQQSAYTRNSTATNRGGGYNPNAQFAPAATVTGTQSVAGYNAEASAGVAATPSALNSANVNANAVTTSHSTATYNGD